MPGTSIIHPPSTGLLHVLRSTTLVRSSFCSIRTHRRPTVRQNISRDSLKLHSFSSSTLTLEPRPNIPTTNDRGPKPTEDTVTDFGSMDVLSTTPAPTTAIDACLSDGFHFDNGLKISGGGGCLLVAGEAFSWRPWDAEGNNRGLLNARGQWEVGREAWGVLDLVWPKPGRHH